MSPYNELLSHELFDTREDHKDFPDPDQIRRSYDRARLICRKSGITVEDVVELRPRFWDFHRHPIVAIDTAVTTILSIHWNLCMGTIASFATSRPDLAPLLQRLSNFDLCGEFLLTEVGHGLDARNLETTATLQPDGSFDLHTPTMAASKAMPPTTPWAGVARIGVVFARLIVHEKDHGVKLSIVNLGNEIQLSPGVTSRALPKRSGAKALDHAITTFDHVRLGPESLLGSPNLAVDHRADFMHQIHRVAVGTLSLSIVNIPMPQQAAFIAGTYSARRHVSANSGSGTIPIIHFSTQYRPILDAFVKTWAYDAFAEEAITIFQESRLSLETRHAVAACFKATVSTDIQATLGQLADRFHAKLKTLTGSVSEVLLGRYKLPEPKNRNCLLARHESGVWREARDLMKLLVGKHHRGEKFNIHMLPRCREIVKATGHRLAYEAAAANYTMKPEALSLFESVCVKTDLGWYCQYEGLDRNAFLMRDAEAAAQVLPQLHAFLGASKELEVPVAPIMYKESWDEFLRQLPIFSASQVATPMRSRL
ncbi:acyloxidase [Seiridium cupressi]